MGFGGHKPIEKMWTDRQVGRPALSLGGGRKRERPRSLASNYLPLQLLANRDLKAGGSLHRGLIHTRTPTQNPLAQCEPILDGNTMIFFLWLGALHMVSVARWLDATTALLRRPTKKPLAEQMGWHKDAHGQGCCTSPAKSPLAGGYREGPKHFFQPRVDCIQKEPQSISAVPQRLVALIWFNLFLRSAWIMFIAWGGGTGGLAGGCITQSLRVTRCQGLFLSLPRTSPVTLRKGAMSLGAAGAGDSLLASISVLKRQQWLGASPLLYKASAGRAAHPTKAPGGFVPRWPLPSALHLCRDAPECQPALRCNAQIFPYSYHDTGNRYKCLKEKKNTVLVRGKKSCLLRAQVVWGWADRSWLNFFLFLFLFFFVFLFLPPKH